MNITAAYDDLIMYSDDFHLRSHRSDDLPWVVQRHGQLYTEEFGWDGRFEQLVAEIVDQFATHFDPAFEHCWIAERDGQRAGCIFLVKAPDPGVAKLRMLLLEPWARGYGLGDRLIQECIQFARMKGYQKLILWTSDALCAARKLYERAGFVLVQEEAHSMFGPSMLGQTWELQLQ